MYICDCMLYMHVYVYMYVYMCVYIYIYIHAWYYVSLSPREGALSPAGSTAGTV